MPHAVPFVTYHVEEPLSPVVIAVPHAGRAYPEACMQLSRLPMSDLLRLEDRYADELVTRCVEAGYATVIARTPRVWLDLNRAETDYPGATPAGGPPLSPKARGGLGVVPTRLSGAGVIWRQAPIVDEVRARVAAIHQPYHAALDAALRAAQRRFGVAVLLDIHSMPPLTGADRVDLVIGNRFGRSCAPHLVQAAYACAQSAGLRVATNTPYAGAYVLDRHGDPAQSRHAIQIELCRRLYLDHLLDQPGDGIVALRRFILHLAGAVAEAALGDRVALAAE